MKCQNETGKQRQMELQTLKTIEVYTFDPGNRCLKVLVPVIDGFLQADKVYTVVTAALGLKKQSWPYFCLFEGLEAPVRCFKTDHMIPEDVDNLSFQKWCFDTEDEEGFIKQDDTALRLVFCQAQAAVERGQIKVSRADLDLLEDYLDPQFTMLHQYMKLCHSLEGYHSYKFSQCKVFYKNPVLQQSVINNNGTCDVLLDLTALKISRGDKTEAYQWLDVKFWQLNTVSNEVCLQVSKSDVTEDLCDIIITSHRCQMLVEVIKATITQLQKTTPDCPKFHVSMINSFDDGITRWENALYRHRQIHTE